MYSPTNRERRVGLALGVQVTGRNAIGRPFSERTRSVNISGGGICFESREQLALGDQLHLAIDLPPKLRARFEGKDVYRARAVVCRIEHFEGADGYRVGARFLGEIGV